VYELRFARGVVKVLNKLAAKEQERIKAALRTLAEEPRDMGSKKLRGTQLYRYRVGSYRIIYGIWDERLVIVVLDVMHRSKDYKSLETLLERWKSLVQNRER
jgi:mRNA interferase RelE/StbE